LSKKSNTVPTAEPADVRQIPLHQETSQRARELWEKYGQPYGRDQEIWLEAERQVLGADPQVKKVGAGSVSAPAFAKRAS
jgi:hypothetical protein